MTGPVQPSARDRARSKAFWHLLPLCFFCYVLSYVDRTNISIAKLTMKVDLPWFTNEVFGDGSGWFFHGYVVLAIGVSTIVGVASGWYPASRAAKLDPVAALRAE